MYREPDTMRAAPPAATAAIERRNLELARMLAEVCADKRAEEVVVLDMRPVCDFADFFVIATAASWPQMKTIAREADKRMKEAGASPRPAGPLRETCWLLLDCGDVVLHLFAPRARDFYALEELWGDAPRVAAAEAETSGGSAGEGR